MAKQARSVGFEPDTLEAGNLAGRATKTRLSDPEVIVKALHRVSEESSTWLLADIARHLAAILPTEQGATAFEVVARIDHLATQAEAHCFGLGPERPDATSRRRDGRPVAEHITDRCLTTEAILGQERALQHWA